MIGSILSFVSNQINTTVCQRLAINPANRKVVLTNIVNPDGTSSINDNNVLIFTLLNIEKDSNALNPLPEVRFSDVAFEKKSPPLYLNLKVLIASHFNAEQLQSGLDTLTIALSFLQGKPLWNAQNTPGLPSSVDRLIFEMETLDFHQLSHLWGTIGAKYMPSAVYKLRMLTIDDGAIQELVSPIKKVAPQTNKSNS